VWHIHLASRQADWGVLMAALLRRPTYVKVASGGATGEVRSGYRSAWLTRRIGLRRAGRVQALSGEIASELQGIGVAQERIVRIPNGLDLSAFRPPQGNERLHDRHRLELPDRSLVVLFVGRLAEYKGTADLLRAWQDVAAEADALLVLVGARGREDRPVSIPLDGPRVLVRPWTSDVAAYLRAADVFAYPAHQDGMSNALLEAMACGLPPVATSIPAVEGLLENERNALLVPPAAPNHLSSALLRLLHEDELRRRIAEGAARTAREYSVEDVVRQIERSYFELTR
jgi:glycosyltransferase involved in cell wall biosynthesis